MKIAFTSKGTGWDSKIDPRFGRAMYILLYDDQADELSYYNNSDVENEAHGAGIKTSRKLFEMNADVLITGIGPGGNALSVLEKTGITMFTGADEMLVKDAYQAYLKGELKQYVG